MDHQQFYDGLTQARKIAARRKTKAEKATEAEEEAWERLTFGQPQEEEESTPEKRDVPFFHCICGDPISDRSIVRCKHYACAVKFFHLDCAGDALDQNDWACGDCKKQHKTNAPKEDQKWITKEDVERMFAPPEVSRGPLGDVYGIDSWRMETGPPQYAEPPTRPVPPKWTIDTARQIFAQRKQFEEKREHAKKGD